MISTLVISSFLAAQCDLTINVNRETIFQCDPLLVKVVASNDGQNPVTLTGKRGPGGSPNRVKYECKSKDTWIAVPLMRDYAVIACVVEESRPILAAQASYAEFDVIFLSRKHFLFDAVGKCQLRALLDTSDGRVESEPVVINVVPRSKHDIQRIVAARDRDVLLRWGIDRLSSNLPEGLIALEDLEGNIGQGVRNLKLLEDIIQGRRDIGKENAAKFLRRHMKGLDWEQGLIVLGTHYQKENDVKRLSEVVDAMPEVTYRSHAWVEYLQLLTPPAFVPSRRSPHESAPGRPEAETGQIGETE